jgi:hypothetical protein
VQERGPALKSADQSRVPEKLRVDFDLVGPAPLEARPFRLKIAFTTAAGMSAEFRFESTSDFGAGIDEVVRCAFAAMKRVDVGQARQAMDAISARMNELLSESGKPESQSIGRESR